MTKLEENKTTFRQCVCSQHAGANLRGALQADPLIFSEHTIIFLEIVSECVGAQENVKFVFFFF